jgi:hypothetical protein
MLWLSKPTELKHKIENMKYIIWSYNDGKYLSDEKGVALEFESEEKALQHLGANYDEERYLIEDIPK